MKNLKEMLVKSELVIMLINISAVLFITSWLDVVTIGYIYIVYSIIGKLADMSLPYLPESWVIHYCNTGEENLILENGFKAPTEELKTKEEYKDLYGQKGLDRISSCFIYTKPFIKMCSRRTDHGKLTPIYIKTKVDNSEITMAAVQIFGIVQRFGLSVETTTERKVINTAIEEGQWSLEKPKSFFNWTHLVLILAGLHTNLTLDKILRGFKLQKETVLL